MSDILSVEGLCLSFGGHRVVDNAQFSVETGSITSLIGPNGAGKTTMFNLITGLLTPQAGEVRFRGETLQGLKPFQISRRGIGRTFQDPRVFPDMSVLGNVMVGLRQRGEGPLAALLQRRAVERETQDVKARAEAALDRVGLLDRAGDRAADLSFGEQRFVSIARTLIGRPPLIMMDEPTVGLDKAGLGKLTALLNDLVHRSGTTILVIEHNMDVVMSMSKKIVLLVEGKVMASDTPAAIRKHRNMVEAYLGRRHLAASH